MMNSETGEVARSVAAELEKSGKSRNWLSVEAKIPYMTLGRKLDGIGEFKFAELGRIAAVLGVRPVEFIPSSFFDEPQPDSESAGVL